MLPHYIVDGYNVIHAIPSLKRLLEHDAAQAREQLAFLIARLTFRRKFRCTLVFDGARSSDIPAPTHSPVHVVYSSPVSADAKIKSMIDQSKNRSLLVIVSSDREILGYAKVCACTTHTSRYFTNMLFEEANQGEEKEATALSRGQIDEWLKIFGEGKTEPPKRKT
ncbi:MAG TPA: NYN domain-containing protein [Bacteroidota bacterium]|nr:NYN domain-containing protein [Bacteroidota bacterium]